MSRRRGFSLDRLRSRKGRGKGTFGAHSVLIACARPRQRKVSCTGFSRLHAFRPSRSTAPVVSELVAAWGESAARCVTPILIGVCVDSRSCLAFPDNTRCQGPRVAANLNASLYETTRRANCQGFGIRNPGTREKSCEPPLACPSFPALSAFNIRWTAVCMHFREMNSGIRLAKPPGSNGIKMAGGQIRGRLPSMAMIWPAVISCNAVIQLNRHAWNSAGLIAPRIALNRSCEGMPSFRSRNCEIGV